MRFQLNQPKSTARTMLTTMMMALYQVVKAVSSMLLSTMYSTQCWMSPELTKWMASGMHYFSLSFLHITLH